MIFHIYLYVYIMFPSRVDQEFLPISYRLDSSFSFIVLQKPLDVAKGHHVEVTGGDQRI